MASVNFMKTSLMATAVSVSALGSGTSISASGTRHQEGLTIEGRELSKVAEHFSYNMGGGLSISQQRPNISVATSKGTEYQDLKREDVWSSSKLIGMLNQPSGSPVNLTREEAIEIILQASGRRPDLPSSRDYVRSVRPDVGYSMIDRVKKQDE